MKKYEKLISFKTLWLLFVRRWKIILVIFVPALLATFVVTQFFVPKQYQSSASLFNNTASNTQTHSSIQLGIQKEKTLTKAVQSLETEYSISITTNEILSGLSCSAYDPNNPGLVKFAFVSKKQNVVKPVADAISKAAYEELIADYPKLTISAHASNPISVGKGRTYFLIGLVASAVLGLGIAFVDEIVSDEVYDEDDIALLGSSSYGLIVTKK